MNTTEIEKLLSELPSFDLYVNHSGEEKDECYGVHHNFGWVGCHENDKFIIYGGSKDDPILNLAVKAPQIIRDLLDEVKRLREDFGR